MSEIRLIIDSSSNDLTDSKRNLIVVPLTISFGGKDYLDNEDLDMQDYLQKMDENNVAGKTSCPSIKEWLEALEGSEKAIIVTMTSQLSGTYSSALQAKDMYLAKNPKSEIIVVDTRSAGPEMKIVLQGIEKILKNNVRWVDVDAAIAKMRTQTHLLFALQSLHNLSLNGRVSPALAKVAKMLHIKLIGTASKEGKLEPLAKLRGMKRVNLEMVKEMKKLNYQGGQVIIDYCQNEDEAEKLKDKILAAFPDADITLQPMHGLCSFYAEKGGLMVGFNEK